MPATPASGTPLFIPESDHVHYIALLSHYSIYSRHVIWTFQALLDTEPLDDSFCAQSPSGRGALTGLGFFLVHLVALGLHWGQGRRRVAGPGAEAPSSTQQRRSVEVKQLEIMGMQNSNQLCCNGSSNNSFVVEESNVSFNLLPTSTCRPHVALFHSRVLLLGASAVVTI